MAGGEMKLSNAVALAQAAGVRLEWLATGEGPEQHSEASPAPAPSAPSDVAERPAFPGLSEERATSTPNDLGLTWQVNPDRLARAYERALKGIAILPGHKPDPRRLMQVTLLLYDEMTEAETGMEAALNAPKPTP